MCSILFPTNTLRKMSSNNVVSFLALNLEIWRDILPLYEKWDVKITSYVEDFCVYKDSLATATPEVISQRTFLSHQLMPLHASTTSRYLPKALIMQIYPIYFSCSDHWSLFAAPVGSNRQVSRASARPIHFTSVENFCIHHTFGVASIFIHLYTVSFLQLQRRIWAEARKLVESSNWGSPPLNCSRLQLLLCRRS